MLDDLSDEALMLRYGEGDAKAFEVLYHRHKDAVYRFVRRQCRDREATRDIVQEIWGKLIRARRRYRPDGRFTAYLFTLAHNRMVNHRRAEARRRPVQGTIVAAVDIGGLPGRDEDNPDARAHLCALIRRAMVYVEALPPMQREAVLLYVEGLTVPEIGRITDVPVENARTRLPRGLAKLRQDLKELEP
jgi:RNA polymerase sigma-70 factor (ECF subfamily)